MYSISARMNSVVVVANAVASACAVHNMNIIYLRHLWACFIYMYGEHTPLASTLILSAFHRIILSPYIVWFSGSKPKPTYIIKFYALCTNVKMKIKTETTVRVPGISNQPPDALSPVHHTPDAFTFALGIDNHFRVCNRVEVRHTSCQTQTTGTHE